MPNKRTLRSGSVALLFKWDSLAEIWSQTNPQLCLLELTTGTTLTDKTEIATGTKNELFAPDGYHTSKTHIYERDYVLLPPY